MTFESDLGILSHPNSQVIRYQSGSQRNKGYSLHDSDFVLTKLFTKLYEQEVFNWKLKDAKDLKPETPPSPMKTRSTGKITASQFSGL